VSKGHWISAFKGNILSSSSGVDMDVRNLDNEGSMFSWNPGIWLPIHAALCPRTRELSATLLQKPTCNVKLY